ncbi:hypothetical protein NDI56_12940 [Haloarcula sp. S1CR25-12]|uniref:Adhesin domain-containing protein n=1 Tax=Haloarcula saliterrae TaxID=2950534 RepID=A0ABU2FDH2_9EURY|nr:hypothetical protein [Haloarcula sp. S1CR25-12]MDS0260303.1 hypothetical protein [Haloarcula sp. S1CR25-12]
MQRDYRLAMYALGVSAVVLAASGAAVIAGAGLPADAEPDTANETNGTQIEADQRQFNVTVSGTGDGEYTLQQADRTCSGVLRLDSPERNRTSHQVGNVTVTLVSHHDGAAFDEVGRQRFAELVVDETGTRAGLGAYDRLEVQVNQYYESTARDEPLDIAGIHVRPADDCLPSVRGTVDLANETVDVRTARADIDEVSLNYTDDIGVLDQADRALIERLVAADGQTSYNVRAHLDATELRATVTEATADGRVDVELQRPDGNGSSVMLTVDRDAETVVHSWVEIQIDEENIRTAGEFEARNASEHPDSVALDLDESAVTVVNETEE